MRCRWNEHGEGAEVYNLKTENEWKRKCRVRRGAIAWLLILLCLARAAALLHLLSIDFLPYHRREPACHVPYVHTYAYDLHDNVRDVMCTCLSQPSTAELFLTHVSSLGCLCPVIQLLLPNNLYVHFTTDVSADRLKVGSHNHNGVDGNTIAIFGVLVVASVCHLFRDGQHDIHKGSIWCV